MWPFGAGGINYHFVYWPGHLNVKVLPDEFLDKTEAKYEEFIEWWKANWELGVPSWHKGKVSYEDWENASYGIKRLRGMISFARSEDWSQRLPEFREYITRLDEMRGTDFRATFPEMGYLLDEPIEDKNDLYFSSFKGRITRAQFRPKHTKYGTLVLGK